MFNYVEAPMLDRSKQACFRTRLNGALFKAIFIHCYCFLKAKI